MSCHFGEGDNDLQYKWKKFGHTFFTSFTSLFPQDMMQYYVVYIGIHTFEITFETTWNNFIPTRRDTGYI